MCNRYDPTPTPKPARRQSCYLSDDKENATTLIEFTFRNERNRRDHRRGRRSDLVSVFIDDEVMGLTVNIDRDFHNRLRRRPVWWSPIPIASQALCSSSLV